jgi:hypothetical protein
MVVYNKNRIFFSGTGIWTQVLYHLSYTSSPLLFSILEMESQELFARAGLKLWSSQSQPPK